jgi:hypothetical protein
MQTALNILLAVALLAVLLVLFTGVAGFVKGGEFNRRWSTRLMALRVGSQAVALLAVGLLLLLRSI